MRNAARDSVVVSIFFFFKQKTAYEIKECDWSSDVCAGDTSFEPPTAGTFENMLIDFTQSSGYYEMEARDQRDVVWQKKLHLDVSALLYSAAKLRELIHSQRDFAGRLREFGGQLYQTFFGQAFDDFLVTPPPRRYCFAVPEELESLPWELFYAASRRLFLVLSPHHSLVRYVKPVKRRPFGAVEPPLRILAFLRETSPRLKEEEALINQLAGSDAGHVALEILSGERATFSELEKTLRVVQPHVLHFSGYREAFRIGFPDHKMSSEPFAELLLDS